MMNDSVSAERGAGPAWALQLDEAQRRPLRIWLWSIAAMTFLVLVIGGITRLTQSGLSIVDWQPLMGVVPPLNEAQWQEAFDRYRAYPEYQQLRRGMSLAEFKVIYFWEYLHRLVARMIGVVFLVPFVVFAVRGRLTRPLLARALLLFGLGALQGVLGWYMVRSGLSERPSVSHYRLAAHLSLAFLIFGLAVWYARDLRPRRRVGSSAFVSAAARRVMARTVAIVGALLAVQIVWGAFVAGLKAGMFYNTFPLMGGSLVPPNLLALQPALLNFVQNAATVQWLHRVIGTLLFIVAHVYFIKVVRAGVDQASRRLNVALFTLIAAQYALGVLTLVLRVPVALGVAHQGMAMIVFGVWVWWAHHVKHLAVADARPAAPPAAAMTAAG